MELTGLNLERNPGRPEYYTWEVAGKPITIQLDFDVVDRLHQEVMQGFGAVPRRGAEVGGLLLGTVEEGAKPAVRIRDFEPVPCAYTRGPSYLLSDAERERFREAVARWQPREGRELRVVGYYRSSTRGEIALTEEDLSLWEDFLPAPSDVVLIIKPYATRVSQAGFFFREDGHVQAATYLEFPFRRQDLGGGASVPKREGRPQNGSSVDGRANGGNGRPDFEERLAPGEEGYGLEEQEAESVVEPPKLKRNYWIPLSFIFLLLGVLLGFQAALTFHPARRAEPVLDPYALGLSMSKDGGSLQITWDRQAPAIQRALGGRLHIRDGDSSRELELSPNQLRTGTVVYRRISPGVTFRLEVMVGAKSGVVETVEFREVGSESEAAPPAAPSSKAPRSKEKR